MYLPKHFAEPRIEVMHELICAHPLASLVTHSPNGLDANHIPLQLVTGSSPFGTLQGHVARANPLWKDVDRQLEVLAIFQGPERYISPSWYTTKIETGKAVPTWNYAVVHAHGTLRTIDDAAWVRTHLKALTAHHEAALPSPWAISDAPADYIEKMIAAIVGIEIVITRLSGKWKTSQNQPLNNQLSVIEALVKNGTDASTKMAALIAEHTQKLQQPD
jgi:transcriptional regulator